MEIIVPINSTIITFNNILKGSVKRNLQIIEGI